MDKIFKKYYIIMGIYLIPFIFIILCCTIRTNYSITTPGGVSKVDQRFEIEDGYDSSDLYSLYVYSTENTTIFQNFIADRFIMFDKSEISDSFSHMTDSLWSQAGVIQKNQSVESSIINAYEYASINNSNIKVEYEYLGVIVRLTTANNNVLKIGDIVSHVDNVKIESLQHYVSLERKVGTKLTVIRDNETINITLNENDDWGSWYYDKFNIISTSPTCTVNSTNSSGPSAGMMQTLSIYNQLTQNDITIKDDNKRSIAGTGTIETNGNIGAIGGVYQKVYSAYESKADILLMSIDNEEEAREAFDSIKNNTTMKLIIVSNFDEVIQCLS